MGEMVEFAGPVGTTPGYLAPPEQGAGLALVIIQEWWGLVPHIKDVCDRFGAEGFTALAPDLYRGATTKEPDEAGKLMMALNMQQAVDDMSGAVDYLSASDRVRGDGVGVVGFCMGGGLALVLACRRPDVVTACVPFYGLIPWRDAEPDWAAMGASVQGHYGENDAFFTPDAARRLQEELRELGKDVEFHFYSGADHGFFNDTRRDVHDADAAGQAWDRTLSFLRSKLG